MTQRLYILFVFAAMIVAAFKIPGPLRERLAGPNNNIDISFTENKKTASLTASYPKNRSKGVHQYIINYFGLADPRFNIVLEDGHLDVRMNKYEDTREAYVKLRGAMEGVKAVLAGNPK